MSEILRSLPHSEEVERAILACVLLRPECWDTAAGLLPSREAFYLERHQLVWGAYAAIRERGEPIDLRTVQAELERAGVYDKVGGLAYLAGLDLDLPDLGRLPTYCAVALDRWAKRRLVGAALALRDQAMNGQPTEETIAIAAAELEAVARDRSTTTGARNMAEVFDTFDPDIQPAPGISTALLDLDRDVGGYRPGSLVVVAARPGMGKSSYAAQLAVDAARRRLRVRFHSLEMTEEEIGQVMIAQVSGVPARDIRAGRLDGHQRGRVAGAAASLADLPGRIDVDATPALTPGQIWAAAALAKLRHGLDLLIIDSLGLLRYVGSQRDKRLQLGEITAACKEQAKRLDVPVLLFHHLSRSHEHEGRAPKMRDLLETGAVERDADMILLPYRPGDYLAEDDPKRDEWRNRAVFIVAKNRGGPAGMAITVSWIPERQLFGNATRQEAPF